MSKIKVICCSDTPEKFSRIVDFELDLDSMEVVETIEQQLGPHFPRDLHNAAHHETHGPVTYVQQVNEGSFAVFVGPPDQLTEHVIEAGMMAAFMDDQGPGHGSKVGPDGVKRTLRVLKGHLQIPS